MLDRAEDLFQELVDQNAFLVRALNGLIAIHEQVRDWENAIAATRRLEQARGSSMRPVIAQYSCELAERLPFRAAMTVRHSCISRVRARRSRNAPVSV